MAIEATPIEPQAVDGSTKHQNLADGVEQLATGAWNWLSAHLPEHETHKPNALNNIKQMYDNAIAAIKADFEATARKAADEAKAAAANLEETAIEGAQSAVQDAASGVAAAEQGQSPTTAESGASDSGSVESTPAAPAEVANQSGETSAS